MELGVGSREVSGGDTGLLFYSAQERLVESVADAEAGASQGIDGGFHFPENSSLFCLLEHAEGAEAYDALVLGFDAGRSIIDQEWHIELFRQHYRLSFACSQVSWQSVHLEPVGDGCPFDPRAFQDQGCAWLPCAFEGDIIVNGFGDGDCRKDPAKDILQACSGKRNDGTGVGNDCHPPVPMRPSGRESSSCSSSLVMVMPGTP